VILAGVGVLPYALGFVSIVYGIIALGLGIEFVRRAIRVFRVRDGEVANKTAMSLFWFSIVYLYVLFAEILIERVIYVIGAMR
jgi:protoheme IX farnesyltransferase